VPNGDGGEDGVDDGNDVVTRLVDRSICAVVGFLGGSVVKNPAASARDAGSIPGSGRSPGVGNGNPLQCSCVENSMDRRAW